MGDGGRLGITAAVIGSVFLAMLLLETARPLRRAVEPKLRRLARNFTTAGIALAAVTLLQTPILLPVSGWANRHGVGLLSLLTLPRWLRIAAAVILMDYTLWFWHYWNHKVPLLWRFHLVHHVDRDLDASTGLRFHFGEQALSVFYRAIQIAAIGADPASVWMWQILLFASVLFHHSNARLPVSLERILVRLVVTPRMHGIHHSDYMNEANSNWSSLLSVWDYLHGTALLDVPQQAVAIGVPAYREGKEVTLGMILVLPFRKQKEDWTRPDEGPPDRPHDPATRTVLSS